MLAAASSDGLRGRHLAWANILGSENTKIDRTWNLAAFITTSKVIK